MTTQSSLRTESQSERTYMTPPVDIFEDDHGITLIADLPGVPKDALQVALDGDTLTIEGEIRLPLGEGAKADYAEIRAGAYRRVFTLSRELNPDMAESKFAQGVLTTTIPKVERAQRRRIEVKTG